ncbi:MAG: hypothetical protein OXE84_08375 [Rhodobacteraceae bacterium]|nr:hypothetical protein [Paracoccaceae bacterium]
MGKTVASLLKQNLKPDSIELYIPRNYRRFPDHVFGLPDIPDGVTVEVINDDLGPATKLLPCVKKYRGSDVRIVYCDDDRIYWKSWLRNIVAIGDERPGECIAYCGYDVPSQNNKPNAFRRRGTGVQNLHKNLPFWIARDLVRLVCWLKGEEDQPKCSMRGPFCGYVDIVEGCNGVLVSSEMFDCKVFDIPPILWAVDDVWISGHLERRCIKRWSLSLFILHRNVHEHSHALLNVAIDGVNRHDANQLCFDHL